MSLQDTVDGSGDVPISREMWALLTGVPCYTGKATGYRVLHLADGTEARVPLWVPPYPYDTQDASQ